MRKKARVYKFRSNRDNPFEAYVRWRSRVKRNSPVYYFFVHFLPRKFRCINDEFNDCIWWFKHRLQPKHRYHVVKTDLKPGYYDPDERILYSCFKLLEEWVEVKKQLRGENWLETTEHALEYPEDPDEFYLLQEQYKVEKEAYILYNWWHYERPRRQDPYEIYHWKNDKIDEIEKQYQDEDDAMLIRLINIRKYLWNP